MILAFRILPFQVQHNTVKVSGILSQYQLKIYNHTKHIWFVFHTPIPNSWHMIMDPYQRWQRIYCKEQIAHEIWTHTKFEKSLIARTR